MLLHTLGRALHGFSLCVNVGNRRSNIPPSSAPWRTPSRPSSVKPAERALGAALPAFLPDGTRPPMDVASAPQESPRPPAPRSPPLRLARDSLPNPPMSTTNRTSAETSPPRSHRDLIGGESQTGDSVSRCSARRWVIGHFPLTCAICHQPVLVDAKRKPVQAVRAARGGVSSAHAGCRRRSSGSARSATGSSWGRAAQTFDASATADGVCVHSGLPPGSRAGRVGIHD